MGAQTGERLQQFRKRYKEWDDPHNETGPYYYGTNYSSAMIFRTKLTMHTAYDRQDNSEPASITSLAISKYFHYFCSFDFHLSNNKLKLLGTTGRCWWETLAAASIRGASRTCPAVQWPTIGCATTRPRLAPNAASDSR